MKTKTSIIMAVETVAGAAVGAAIGGPLGAVAGGLAARHIHSDIEMEPQTGLPVDIGRDPMLHAHVKQILVPLDRLSEPSQSTARFAGAWAQIFAAEICLLHVVDPTTAFVEAGTTPMAGAPADHAGRAKAALEELSRRELSSLARVRVEVRDGVAADEIVAAALQLKTDLIVMATHGRTGLSHALLGSTAERVVRHAPCPVLTLRTLANDAGNSYASPPP